MSKENKPRSRRDNIVVQEVDGETLIYDLESNKALCLNHTSAIVWQACDGKRTIAEINDLLGKQLKVQTNEDIVWLALDQLSKAKLVDPRVDLGTKFQNLSRREVIRKIGIGSMIALPMVASLVAPTAVHAVTLGAPGSPVGTPLSLAANMCVSTPDANARDAACNTAYMSLCTSNSSEQLPLSCMPDTPVTGTSTFSCRCM
jgi:hypothetical protein